jgi:peroxiredoxin Q/BCP
MAIKVGDLVNHFTAVTADGSSFDSNDYIGKQPLVIYFYPKDMTPGCTTESCDFRDGHPQFRALNTEVIGISPDDLKSHGKFINKYELPFLLLADTEHTVCEQFGVWKLKKMYGKEYMGVERSTFLIDEAGHLVKEWRAVKVDGHVTDVLRAVQEV